MRRVGFHVLTALGCMAAVTPLAPAGVVLHLSQVSSDETDPADLAATLSFETLENELRLTVMNETSLLDGFDISAVYFNASEDVIDLSLLSGAPGWQLFANEGADGFGVFDFAVLSPVGNDVNELPPQQIHTFNFSVTSAAPIGETAFVTELSTIPPGSTPSLVAIKFVNGPGDDSAFGATIPEPATVLLLGVGVMAIRRRTCRR